MVRPRRNRRRPLEVQRHRARLAGLDVEDAQRVERLIEDVARVALPRRRVRAIGGDLPWRAERRPGARHRPHRQRPLVDRGHLGAVRRPRRSAAAARVDPHHRRRHVPRIGAAGGGDREDLVGAFAEARAERSDAGQRHARPIRRPRRRARLRQRVVNLRHGAGGDVQNRHLRHAPHAVDVEEHHLLAIGRERGALRLGGERGDLSGLPALHVADPQLQQRAGLVRRVDETAAVGRPRRIGVERGVVRQVDRLAARRRHDVDVAHGGERDLAAIGRDDRAHDAQRLSRRRGGEVAHTARVLRAA